MDSKDKIEFWLKNLQLFALNSEVQCSREEKVIKQELIGTRHVNFAFNQMLKHMHDDLSYPYENVVNQPVVIVDGRQVLLFKIGDDNYYTDITAIHEVLRYPTKNYNQIKINDNAPMVGILNWYEGLVPMIQTHLLLEEKKVEVKEKVEVEENYLLVYDIGKEIFAFTITQVFPKHEIEKSVFGKDFEINDQFFKFFDFMSYEKRLIEIRLKFKL